MSVVDSYQLCLEQHPVVTKALTSGALFGVGDLLAQVQPRREEEPSSLDVLRFSKFVITGCGSGVLWGFYYDHVDVITSAATEDIWGKVALSMTIEQFLWCPIVYSLYLIPMSTLLNGGSPKDAVSTVRRELGGLLVKNAQVWTAANMVLYGVVPLRYRVIAANLVDILWAVICANTAAECGSDECVVENEALDYAYIRKCLPMRRRLGKLPRGFLRTAVALDSKRDSEV